MTISATNAEEVAAASYKTTAGLQGSGGVTDLVAFGAVTDTSSQGIDLVEFLLTQVKHNLRLAADGSAMLLTGVAVPETIDCPYGGSITITYDVANPQQPSIGDSMSFAANGCLVEGGSMNGSMSMSVLNVDGNPFSELPVPPYGMQLSMQANNFTVTDGVETFTLHGGMTMSESTTDGVFLTHSITGSSIQVTEGGVNAGLSNFDIEATDDNNTQAYTLDLNATVSSSELGGSVTIVTYTLFQGIDPNEPTSGQATITGANNSRVTLTAMGGDMVQLVIDEDGDGIAEEVLNRTWNDL